MMYKILLVEDDKNISEMLCDYFTEKSSNKILIDVADNGKKGADMAYENTYDLLLLDIMLPQLDGFEICKEVRRFSDVPIMFITARCAQEDILTGYALGCDDYIVKPFSLPVFYNKVNALIKRSKGLVRSPLLKSGTLSLNPNNGIVVSDEREINLPAKEYSILKTLLENKGCVVSRDALIKAAWGYDSEVDERALDTHIKNLRKALGDNSKMIKTVVKRGYRIGEN
ncbi:response regulator transcription factor [Ruminococcus sp.]|uniref:response regulator transcription factor n=1 Tax=Ruminococcus sp. TaxID=41978 RepID=UPI0025D16130|nr:response regulator transcription factor [Ruminococcus sp.]MCI6616155.1 response regulator transcription factor [Ruminococcus sp.]